MSITSKMYAATLAGGLAILPFVHQLGTTVPYEVPKVISTLWWIKALAILKLVELFIERSSSKTRLKPRLLIALMVYVVLIIGTAILGTDISRSIWGNYFRYDGVFTLAHLVVLALCIGTTDEKSLGLAMKWAVAGALSMGLLAIWDGIVWARYHTYRLSLWGGAQGSFFGQPILLASYLAVMAPLVWHAMTQKHKVYGYMSLVILLFAQIATTSIAGTGLISLLLAHRLLQEISRHKVKLFGYLLVGVASTIGAAYIVMNTVHRDYVAEGRERIYPQLLDGILQRPLTGYGWSNIDTAFEQGDAPFETSHDIYLDKAHNIMLEHAASGGILVLVAHLGLVTLVLKELYRLNCSQKIAGTLFAVALMYLAFASTNVIGISTETIWWIVVGYALKA